MRRYLRFSLRTLLSSVMLLGSAVTLWLHWEPWYLQARLTKEFHRISFAAFDSECKKAVWMEGGYAVHVCDLLSGEEISTRDAPSVEHREEGVLNGHPVW